MAEKKEKETEAVPTDTPQDDPWLVKLKNYPLDELKKKGWKTRIKTKPDGKRYITLVARIKDDDGKYHATDRSVGPYTLEKWEYVTSILPIQEKKEKIISRELDDIMNTQVKPPDAELVEKIEKNAELNMEQESTANKEETVQDDALTQEDEGTQIQNEPEQPKATEQDVMLRDQKAKMFTTVVARYGAIPPSISFASDIVTYFEYFQAKGYKGNLNDWMHEAVRNYLAEKQIQLQIMIGKLEGE